jgi:hypothetical protein
MFRSRDPLAVEQAVDQHLERNEQLARSALARYENDGSGGPEESARTASG